MGGFCNHCKMRYDGDECPICHRKGLAKPPDQPPEYYNSTNKHQGNKAGRFIGILVIVVLGSISLIFVMPFLDTNLLTIIPKQGTDFEINFGEELGMENPEEAVPKDEKENEPKKFFEDFTQALTPKPLDTKKLEQKIHELINKERTENGLTPLKLNQKISDIARQHSQDMADRNYFEHDSPEGKSFEDRYKENNFNCEIVISESSTELITETANEITTEITTETLYATGAENISFTEGYTGEDTIAKTMVDGWMNSPGHRKNILTSYFESEGIGVVKTGNKVYATQNFC